MNKNILEIIQNSNFEMKTIEEISKKISSGGTPKTGIKEYYNGEIPWLRTQEVNFGEIWKTGVKITEAGVANSSAKWIPANCVIVAMYGATVGKIGINKIPMTTNQACCNIEVDETIADYRYVFHFLMMQYEYIKSLGTGSQTNINAQIVKNLEIPIPPLEIQQKVVEILDKMTDYVTELTAELTLRQKQYAYYRDKLLTFPSQSDSDESLSVRWLKMGEFGEFIRGNGMQKKDFVESGFPAIHYGQIYTKYGLTADETFTFVTDELASKLKIADKNDLIIATTSENVEDILKPLAWLGGKVAIGGHESLFRHNENVKYLAYYFQTTEFQQMKQKYIVGTKVKDISKENLSNLTVPLPPLKVQSKIVEILDKFDKLTSDLTEGLPHEIELRQKQYEYWREQLLSFKKE